MGGCITVPADVAGTWWRIRESEDTGSGQISILKDGMYSASYHDTCCGSGTAYTKVSSCFCSASETDVAAYGCCGGAAQVVVNKDTSEPELHWNGMRFTRRILHTDRFNARPKVADTHGPLFADFEKKEAKSVDAKRSPFMHMTRLALQTRKCTTCDQPLGFPIARFCPTCSAAVSHDPPYVLPPAVMQTCMHCSAVNHGLHTYCVYCGHAMRSLQTLPASSAATGTTGGSSTSATITQERTLVLTATMPSAPPTSVMA